jgi:hypothetical protein
MFLGARKSRTALVVLAATAASWHVLLGQPNDLMGQIFDAPDLGI